MPKLIINRDLIALTFGREKQGPIRACAFVYFFPWMFSDKCGPRTRLVGSFAYTIEQVS